MLKPYAIFGAGLSGQAASRLAQAEGLEVVLFDEAGRGERSVFDVEDVSAFGGFVFSPGFAAGHPWRDLVEASGAPCLSELAWAAGFWQGRIIGVTGTNGKSTLTALLDEAFRQSGQTSVAAGNIGYPLADAVLSNANTTEATAVVEISSFQAELAGELELDALLWTNFAEDHLDRYASMECYFAAKARLFDCLKEGGTCVVGPGVAGWFDRFGQPPAACMVADSETALLAQLSPESLFRRSPNSENFLMAATFWHSLGLPTAPLVEAANAFRLAPHRLALVAEAGGVRFWDDSKATNFHAALAAVQSVARPIVWIGGGRAKGGDVEAFAREIAPHIDAAILYGEVAKRLANALDGVLESVDVHRPFAEAVASAAEIAASMPAANVVLSPGFASFDQFDSYGARGKNFADMVLSLKNAGKSC